LKALLIHARRIPTKEVITRNPASRLSTLPNSPCLLAPIIALPNLWVMLLPTATTPGTPRFIMPGVMKKAPPLPMKPLRVPPMNPKMITCTAAARSSSVKCPKRAPLMTSVSFPVPPSIRYSILISLRAALATVP
jgi:hypothetical protein